ncbi:hypothetical protein PORY_002676 [Pneumocystis oryctolagi]|uniref:Uncharacterized protein n=1 Tax=Pneumocystis oryctolagi TaxID=42067 RepID=A0ACB7C8D9_9ASCO|nr:hypothetical protein PORY_002676 [Pneumocystis oryctolagi]
MHSKSTGSAVSETQSTALHAARLAMLKQINLHFPIEESKIWSDDAQADIFSVGSTDQRSVATGITGFTSTTDSHYYIPKKKTSVPLFFHSDKESFRFQTLHKNKFSTLSLRSSSKKKSAAGRFVLHLKRTFSSKNLLFQRSISPSSHYKENFCPHSFSLKDLSKNDQISPFTLYASNSLTNINPSKKIDENNEFSQLKKKVAALEILETQNGKENRPLFENKNNALAVLPEDKNSLVVLPEENNDDFFTNTVENDNIVPLSCMASNASLGSIDHRDNTRPIRLLKDEMSPTSKLNYTLYSPQCISSYDKETGNNSLTHLCNYYQNSPSLTQPFRLKTFIPYDTSSSKFGNSLYPKSYNIRSPSGLEKAVNFNYGGIDEWRKEIRNCMHLEKKR